MVKKLRKRGGTAKNSRNGWDGKKSWDGVRMAKCTEWGGGGKNSDGLGGSGRYAHVI